MTDLIIYNATTYEVVAIIENVEDIDRNVVLNDMYEFTFVNQDADVLEHDNETGLVKINLNRMNVLYLDDYRGRYED